MLEDRSHSGRPPAWDIEATKEAVENQISTNTHRLSNLLGPSKNTIYRHLKSLDKIIQHTAKVTEDMIKELVGIELLLHPAFSLDLA